MPFPSRVRIFLENEDILAGPHDVKGLFRLGFEFRFELVEAEVRVRFRHLAGMVTFEEGPWGLLTGSVLTHGFVLCKTTAKL